MRNSIEWFETMSALADLGVTAVPMHAKLLPGEVRRLVDHSEPAAMVVDDLQNADAALEWSASANHLDTVVVVGARGRSGAAPYEGLIETGSSSERPPATAPATITYTSGTTGRPKGALRSTQPGRVVAIGKMLLDMFRRLRFGPDERHLLCCPVSHSAPPFYAQFALALGGQVVIMDRFDAERALQLIETEKITSAFMVPTMLNRIVSLPEEVRRQYDLSSIRALISGGASLPSGLKPRVMEVFGKHCLFDVYGTTEAGNISLLEPGDQLRKSESVGRPVKGVKLRVVNPGGSELPQGRAGDVQVKTPLLFGGYHRDDADHGLTEDGYFTTGDVGLLDDDGFLHIVGRRSDVIIRGGVKIQPQDIETVLRTHPSVFDVVAVGVPDEDLGQEIKAFVELHDGWVPDERPLLELCARGLSQFKRPRSIEFVDELPRNPAGKVLRRKLSAPRESETKSDR